jgi:imidazolonepropionase-like amidohydrolase
VASTDCGEPQIFPNLLWRDIRSLHERGLTRMGAIQAATSKAAALLGIEQTVGSIFPGKQADLILVRGNPLDDLAALSRIAMVAQAGQKVFEA